LFSIFTLQPPQAGKGSVILRHNFDEAGEVQIAAPDMAMKS
jgi:hypothetical protein